MANEVEIVVRARDQSAAGIDAAKANLRGLAKAARDVPNDIKIKTEADVAKAEADIARLEEKLARNDVAKFKVQADTEAAEAGLEKLRLQADRATGERKIEVKAKIAEAEAKLAALGAKMRHLDTDTVSATHQVERLQRALARFGEDGESSLDRLHKKLKEVKDKGFSPLITAALALGPALLPIAGQAVTIVGSLATSLVSVAAAAGVFGAVVKGAFSEVKEAADKTDGLREKIRLLDREIKLAEPGSKLQTKLIDARAKATLELAARLSLLPPATRRVVSAFEAMKTAWDDLKDDNKATSFGILTRVFKLAQEIIPKLQPLFDAGAHAADKLISVFERKVKDGGVERLIKWLAEHAKGALADTVAIFTNLAVALSGFLKATDDGGGALHWVEQMTKKLADFTKSQAFLDFLQWVRSNGKQVGKTLADIAVAALRIAAAVAPLSPISLALADALAAIVNAIPKPVLTGIVAGLVAWSVAVRAIAAADIIWGAASAIATAAQWALNAALDANPIGAVIVLVAALAAGLIYAYTHSARFRAIVDAVGSAIKRAAGAVVGFAQTLIHYVGVAVAFVIDKFGDMASFVGGVMVAIGGPLSGAGHALQNLGASAHAAAQKVRDVADAMAGVHSKTVTLAVNHIDIFSTKTIGGAGSGQPGPWAGGYVGARASGGIVGSYAAGGGPRSHMTLVGEQGPELVNLPPGSMVYSHGDTERMTTPRYSHASPPPRPDAHQQHRAHEAHEEHEKYLHDLHEMHELHKQHEHNKGHARKRAKRGATHRGRGGSSAGITDTPIFGDGLSGSSPEEVKVVLEFHSGGTSLDDLLVQIVRRAVRVRGGNVQTVLGR